jgi:hypothetical protein
MLGVGDEARIALASLLVRRRKVGMVSCPNSEAVSTVQNDRKGHEWRGSELLIQKVNGEHTSHTNGSAQSFQNTVEL